MRLTEEQRKMFWKNGIGTDVKEMSLEELEVALECYWELEISDHGSSGFDIKFETFPNCFPSINKIRDEFVSREVISEENFNRYMVGCNEKGRICNLYDTVGKWAQDCEKERASLEEDNSEIDR